MFDNTKKIFGFYICNVIWLDTFSHIVFCLSALTVRLVVCFEANKLKAKIKYSAYFMLVFLLLLVCLVAFATHIQFFGFLWLMSGFLALHPRSRPETPGHTGSPRTGCGHRADPAPGPLSPEDNSHSTSAEHRIKHNTLTCVHNADLSKNIQNFHREL